jgi:hypothetical protein
LTQRKEALYQLGQNNQWLHLGKDRVELKLMRLDRQDHLRLATVGMQVQTRTIEETLSITYSRVTRRRLGSTQESRISIVTCIDAAMESELPLHKRDMETTYPTIPEMQ